ncbi:MAG: DNA polymerase III subunit delta [Firmicutes bacterium]|nr:DNA polymerase III subunit delta [Bacillota bacterium]
MKFADLKQSLKTKAEPVYLVTGDDLYLRAAAVRLITERCVPNMPDLNMVKFTSEAAEFSDVVNACLTLPMMDEFRLVIVKDWEPKKTESNKKLLADYITSPVPSACLVLVAEPDDGFYKTAAAGVCVVDCNKLDLPLLKKVTQSFFAKDKVAIEPQALDLLIQYCSFNLARIEVEAIKLAALAGSGGQVGLQTVTDNVTKDIEYVAYELADTIANKNAVRAMEIVGAMLADKESAQSILVLVLAAFRRMFYACTQAASDADVARALGVKDYAIKMAKKSGQKFSKMQLKQILELGGELDFKIRRGEISDEVALNSFVFEILSM